MKISEMPLYTGDTAGVYTPVVINGNKKIDFKQAVQIIVQAAINQLVGAAPQLLDTLKEISDQIIADEGAAAAMAILVGQKLAIEDVVNVLSQTAAGKVLDARQGKVLKEMIEQVTFTLNVDGGLKKTQTSGQPDKIEANVSIPFTASIPFDAITTVMQRIGGATAYTPNTTGAVPAGSAFVRHVADGVNEPSFVGFQKTSGSEPFDNTSGRVHLITFFFDTVDYNYTITKGKLIDNTPPTISSATITDSHTIQEIYSEQVTGTNTGHSFKQNGTVINPSSIIGSGTNTLTFTFTQTFLYSDTVLRSYNSTTGDTLDGAGNELVSFTDQLVTNATAAPGTDLAFASRTALTKTGQLFTPASNDNTFNHTGLDALFLAAGASGRIYFQFKTGDHDGLLGFNVANTQVTYQDMLASIFVSGANPQKVGTTYSGGNFANLVDPVNNMWYGLYRNGVTGEFTPQSSPDESTWTNVGPPLSVTNTGKLQIVCCVHGSAGAILRTPKIMGGS